MMAGPASTAPGRSPRRGTRSTSAHRPPVNIGTRAAPGAAVRPAAAVLAARAGWPPARAPAAAVSSTDTASSSTGLSGIRKENCCR